jgi:alpha-1,2-mannosyltransferase
MSSLEASDPLFDRRRMRAYPRIALIVYLVAGIALAVSSRGLVDPLGKPLGYDFITFWSASRLTLDGNPAAAFDFNAIGAAQRLAVPASKKLFLWHYPPTYQLLIAPLALLPYLPSYLLFVGITLCAYLALVRRLLDLRDAYVLILAFPATFICAFHGQNSFISAALFAAAVLTMVRAPPLAALCFGLLAFKPQLGILVPVALIAARQWRMLAICAFTAAAYAGLSTLVFGLDLWRAFLHNGLVVRSVLEQAMLPWDKMPTAFVFLRLLALPAWFAYAAQAATALVAGLAVVVVWRRCGITYLSGAALVSATLLVSPYLFDYEMAMLAVPLAIVASDMARRGYSKWERISLLALYLSPALMVPIAEITHVQAGFPALALALVICVRRALSAAPATRAGSPSGAPVGLTDVNDRGMIRIDTPPAR